MFCACARSHDALVVNSDIHEQLVERDILLGVGADEVMKLQAGNGQHRLTIQFGVIQSI